MATNWIAATLLSGTATIAVAGTAVYSGLISPDLLNSFSSNLQPVATAPVTPGKAPEKPKAADTSQLAAIAPETSQPAKPAKIDPAPSSETLPAPKAPSFDIMRVEEDGSVLIAGKAEPGAKVQVIDGKGDILAETQAGPSGDFVALPDSTLEPGSHALNLLSTLEGKDPVRSAQGGIIQIPRQAGGNLLALVTEDGAASRILIKPKALEAKPEPVETKKPDEVAKQLPKPVQEPAPEPLVKPERTTTESPTETAAISEAPADPVLPAAEPSAEKQPPTENAKPALEKKQPIETASLAPEQAPVSPSVLVAVEAVEIEQGTVFVAGAAKPGAAVRVYIDDQPVGLTYGTADSRFLLSKNFQLKPGRHTVRADMIDGRSGKVISRAEVPLIHEVETAPVVAQTPNVVKSEPTQEIVIAKAEPAAPQPSAAPEPVAEPNTAKPQVKPASEDQSPKAPVAKATPKLASQAKAPSMSPATTTLAGVESSAVEEAPKVVAADAEPEEDVIRTGTSVIIKPGDNLWRISRKTYGRGIRYTTIYNANRDQIRNPSRIYIGQIFKIPELASQE